MAEYTVKHVHQDPPKEWNNPKGGVIYYRTVDLFEHNKPVSIGKKDPDALKTGLKVYGDIIPTDYMEDKFKASPPPQSGAQSSDGSNQYLKDLSDLPLRVYTSSVGLFDTQALVKGGTYYTDFVTYIQNISNDLLLMAENIRKGETAKVEVKDMISKAEPLPTPPEDLGFTDDDYTG